MHAWAPSLFYLLLLLFVCMCMYIKVKVERTKLDAKFLDKVEQHQNLSNNAEQFKMNNEHILCMHGAIVRLAFNLHSFNFVCFYLIDILLILSCPQKLFSLNNNQFFNQGSYT